MYYNLFILFTYLIDVYAALKDISITRQRPALWWKEANHCPIGNWRPLAGRCETFKEKGIVKEKASIS